jgi:CelD/BcsL family acetyltransferase involved in cellulose biosynthesis
LEPGVIAEPPAVERTQTRTAGTGADALEVERRSDLELNAADRATFEEIVDAQPDVGVFASHAWLSGFFEEPPPNVSVAMLLFRKSGALCGFVPIAVRTALRHTRVTLLGGGLGSDRIDVMAAPGARTACADAFLGWLTATFGRSGFVLELRDVPAESALWGAIHRAGLTRTAAVTLGVHEIQPLPYLSLGDGLPATASDSLDKHRRWLARRGDITVDLVREAGEAAAAFQTLTEFLRDRWTGRGGSTLDDATRWRFHERVIPRLLAEGRLRMIRLAADGRTVAVYYGLAAGRWWGYYLAGFDREWAGRIHLGRILLATAIEQAVQQGASEFDFLKGAEPVKYLWPVRERTTLDADVASHHAGAQLTRAARAARETAAALVKSVRGWRSSPS